MDEPSYTDIYCPECGSTNGWVLETRGRRNAGPNDIPPEFSCVECGHTVFKGLLMEYRDRQNDVPPGLSPIEPERR